MSEEIKKLLGTEKLLIGAKQTLKGLKKNSISKVFLAENCPEDIRAEITYLANFNKVPVQELGIRVDDVGVLCKKAFHIAVLSVKS